jgi:hypothetical protein
MKSKWIAVGVATWLGGIAGTAPVNASTSVGVGVSVGITAEADFNAPLAAHGSWVAVEGYGRCWRPAVVEIGWRPYSTGYWVWTDYGWYWVSDEPWSWACYHYGRWVYSPRHAWVWTPGIEWSPAWVTWRVGGDFVGWAPLPPRLDFRGNVIVASSVNIAPEHFVFVQSGRFHERVTPKTVIVNNNTVIQKTTLITNIKRVDGAAAGGASGRVVFNEGPGLASMQKATGQKVRRVTMDEAARSTPVPASIARQDKPERGASPGRHDGALTPTGRDNGNPLRGTTPPDSEARKNKPEGKPQGELSPGQPPGFNRPDRDKEKGPSGKEFAPPRGRPDDQDSPGLDRKRGEGRGKGKHGPF